MDEHLIYDVGMHNGNDTAFYLACGFRVVAIEANPDFATAARERFAPEIAAKKLAVLNIGISDHDATAEFWINDKAPHFNSFDRAWAERPGDACHSVVIPCRRLDQVLKEHGVPYYLKIDIEGFDLIALDSIDASDKPSYISVEMSRVGLLHKLKDLGYDRFKLVTQLDLQPVEPGETKAHVRMLRSIYIFANSRLENRSLPLRAARAAAAKILKCAGAFGLGPWGHFENKIAQSARLGIHRGMLRDFRWGFAGSVGHWR